LSRRFRTRKFRTERSHRRKNSRQDAKAEKISRQDAKPPRWNKKKTLNEGGQGTNAGSAVIGPKVNQPRNMWKLVSSFLRGFASWREIFSALASWREFSNAYFGYHSNGLGVIISKTVG
jgi:hypothetical protein